MFELTVSKWQDEHFLLSPDTVTDFPEKCTTSLQLTFENFFSGFGFRPSVSWISASARNVRFTNTDDWLVGTVLCSYSDLTFREKAGQEEYDGGGNFVWFFFCLVFYFCNHTVVFRTLLLVTILSFSSDPCVLLIIIIFYSTGFPRCGGNQNQSKQSTEWYLSEVTFDLGLLEAGVLRLNLRTVCLRRLLCLWYAGYYPRSSLLYITLMSSCSMPQALVRVCSALLTGMYFMRWIGGGFSHRKHRALSCCRLWSRGLYLLCLH